MNGGKRMNKVILMGRLTRDPETRVSGEMTIAKFSLAVDRRGKNNESDFINCVAFDKTAEFIEKYFHKGSKMLLEGRWQTGSFTNKDGQKVYTNDCVVEQVEFCESKKAEAQTTEPEGDFMNIPEGIEEDLPFSKPSSLPV